MSWLNQIDPFEVMLHATPVQILDFDPKYTIDDAAKLMVKGGARFFASLKSEEQVKLLKGQLETRSAEDPRPPAEYWPRVKAEFFTFLCTEDPRYADLRSQLNTAVKVSGSSVVSAISAAIAIQLSAIAGSLVGLVAVCLYGVLKIGKEAFCAIYR